MEHTDADGQHDRPLLNILGEKIALGPVQKSMLPAFERWHNDFAVTIMSGNPLRPVDREESEATYERHSKRKAGGEYIEFAIYERASWRLIGIAILSHINHLMRNAEYGILIGEKDCWGKGYGTETTILMLDYAFTVLGLHNVLLNTYGYNERGIRAYTRAGFRVVGRWREAARVSDQVYDIIFMDCLSTEFRSPLRRVIDLP
jgi:RimJ/RimL family protein N-acetyltransferase